MIKTVFFCTFFVDYEETIHLRFKRGKSGNLMLEVENIHCRLIELALTSRKEFNPDQNFH